MRISVFRTIKAIVKLIGKISTSACGNDKIANVFESRVPWVVRHPSSHSFLNERMSCLRSDKWSIS